MRFEHLLQALLGHSRAFIVDLQNEPTAAVDHPQVRTLTILQGVVQQVADAAPERQRLARIGRHRSSFQGDPAAAQVRLDQALQHLVQVDALDVLVDVGVFHTLQRTLDQHFQFI
ncbi:hypothetical protein FQZ97_1160690 [compost metagenome]